MFMKKLSLSVLCCLLAQVILYAQQHQPNQLIVQLEYGKDVENSLKQMNLLLPDGNFELKQDLSKTLNIWLIGYNEQLVPSNRAIDVLESLSDIALAQVNHTNIENRNTPDDPDFGGQWCHFQSSDADMDSEEAWDVTTGGVTAMGDTIVVAVVDGGQDLTHEDLDYWKNYNEIAGNLIDDDNNGYVDDVNGWHVYSSGGTVYEDEDVSSAGVWDDHGIHVAGIIGAKGNNSTGVVGVNWNVKIMAVRGSSTEESVLIKSYGYVYDQRMIYNRSGGDSGAYVVATNSSFGVNYGDPADYPIWCALYDSLGRAGILSAVAGPNLGIDIDSQGDVPGTCPSNYTISTTNSRDNDNRNASAGYGATQCDIAAPGTDVYSTTKGNTYGYKTGTSMATPQVAGAVALMYAAAPYQMLANNLDYPSVTAATIRDYMLTYGFDSIASMDGQSVTGGRLNLFKAVQSLENYDTTSTGLATKEMLNDIIIFPNPSNQFLTIQVNGVTNGNITIVNMLGAIVYQNSTNGTKMIDISQFGSGVYYLIINNGMADRSKRIVIQH